MKPSKGGSKEHTFPSRHFSAFSGTSAPREEKHSFTKSQCSTCHSFLWSSLCFLTWYQLVCLGNISIHLHSKIIIPQNDEFILLNIWEQRESKRKEKRKKRKLKSLVLCSVGDTKIKKTLHLSLGRCKEETDRSCAYVMSPTRQGKKKEGVISHAYVQ